MMDNTTVIVYGMSDENKKRLVEDFDWRDILLSSDILTQHEHNSNVYICDNQYALSVSKKSICVHPGGTSIIKRVKDDLLKVVSKYYHCPCYVSGDFSRIVVSIKSTEECNPLGIKAGEIIEFGCYPQGKNLEILPIRWKVLHTDAQIALLIAEDGLIMSGYCDMKKAYGNMWYLMWGNSLAREMCNGLFYHKAFNVDEKYIIRPKEMLEPLNGPKCCDEVFVLSENEVVLFMGNNENRKAKPSLGVQSEKTKYGGGVFQLEGYTSWWVLPEEDNYYNIYPKAVWPNGEIQYHGRNGYHGDFTIRPCIQIDLERYQKYQEKQKKNQDNKPCNVSVKTKETVSYPKISGGQAYSLDYIRGYNDVKRGNYPGARTARYDESMEKWRLTIQLDDAGEWFLSVFVRNDGTFEKYSLDQEIASDSHYEFCNEKELRRKIYSPGDENKYLAEVLIGYVSLYGGNSLVKALRPFLTAEYHFD